ncbi:MAG: hypothetical protein U1F83_04650 [Verrucomicrobiota bacterium]
MTAPQAKQILLTYRPWTNDAQDPEVAEALAFCQQDAQLAKWLENHCAVQNAIHARFQAIPVPEGLRQQIVSEFKSRALAVWWRRPAVLATAATVMLVIAIGSLWLNFPRQPKQDVSFAAYRNRLVREVVKNYAMDLETNDVAQIRSFLAQRQSHGDYVLPKGLEQTPAVGCGILSWQGKPVAMVCFRTGKPLSPGAKSDLFLFVIDQKDLLNPPQPSAPLFAGVSTLVTATWNEGGKVYVLAGSDAADLKQRL